MDCKLQWPAAEESQGDCNCLETGCLVGGNMSPNNCSLHLIYKRRLICEVSLCSRELNSTVCQLVVFCLSSCKVAQHLFDLQLNRQPAATTPLVVEEFMGFWLDWEYTWLIFVLCEFGHKQISCDCQLDPLQWQTVSRLTPSYCRFISIQVFNATIQRPQIDCELSW